MVHVASGREWRGGQRQVLLLARGMREQGEVPTLVITGAGTALAERLADAGVPTHLVTWSMGLDPRVVRGILAVAAPGTIIHSHDSHAHTLADAAIRLRRLPLVATRRVAFPVRHPARWRRADHVIALSTPIAEQMHAAGVPREQVSIIPSGVDLDILTRPRTLTALPGLPPPGAPLILCIAALTPEKGIDVLIAAAALLANTTPDAHWLVLGEGARRQALQRQIRAAGLEGRVHLAGDVPEPHGYLTAATLAVQPSRSEGFGSAVLDAMAAGVPVVASDTGGLPEALAGGGGLLVPPGNADRLAAAVRQLLDNPAEREALGAAGRTAATQFAVPRLVARTLDVYRSLDLLPDGR
ncbi:MAG: glycosyltransferase family 4 protein [Gemmatimonadales bacterium]|nr:glycosyltransferase family 4 protein [Gemmatimonadales bacterium]